MKNTFITNHTTSIGNSILWTTLYFLLLLSVTIVDMFIWRKIADSVSVWLNVITLLIASFLFFYILIQKTYFKINLFTNISGLEIISAISCALIFYLLLDKTLDPIFESLFPMSEADYQETLDTLRQSPISSFFRVCLIAPFVEEILMRGYILGGLLNKYGWSAALLISALLFAFLHFNMVQTLSAFICGIMLGALYLKTNSIFCCILAHSLYNIISYYTMIYLK